MNVEDHFEQIRHWLDRRCVLFFLAAFTFVVCLTICAL